MQLTRDEFNALVEAIAQIEDAASPRLRKNEQTGRRTRYYELDEHTYERLRQLRLRLERQQVEH